jgi:hypothetical protein
MVSVLSVPRSQTATSTVAMRKPIMPTAITGSGAVSARGSDGMGSGMQSTLVTETWQANSYAVESSLV